MGLKQMHQSRKPTSSILRQLLTPRQPVLGLILKAKTDFLAAVKKAKTTKGCLVQEAEAACSKAICEVEAWKVSQATIFHKEHGKYMRDLEEQAIGEESRSCNDFLSTCQVILYNSPLQLRGALSHITSYWGKHLRQLHLSCHRRLLLWKNSQLQLLPPQQCPNNLLGPKGDTLCQILWRACLWAEPLQRLLSEDPPAPRGKTPPWFKTLKPSCAEVFS